MRTTVFIYLIIVFLFSCKENKYTILDFDKNLQVKLDALIQKNDLNTCDGKLLEEFDKVDLQTIIKFTKCDKPLIRGLGAYLYVSRKEFNINGFFYELLKDTGSLKQTDCTCGFCGSSTYKSNVAEVATKLNRNYWRNKNYKGRVEYQRVLIKNYPYLEETFYALIDFDKEELEGLEPAIRKIIFNTKSFIFKEAALLALAKCGNSEDLQLVNDSLKFNIELLTKTTFYNLNMFKPKQFDPFFQVLYTKMTSLEKNKIQKYYSYYIEELKKSNNPFRQNLLISCWNKIKSINNEEKKLNYQEYFLSSSNAYYAGRDKDSNSYNAFYENLLLSDEMVLIRKLIKDRNAINNLEEHIKYEKGEGVYAVNNKKLNNDDPPPPPPPFFDDSLGNLDLKEYTKEGIEKIKKLHKEYMLIKKD